MSAVIHSLPVRHRALAPGAPPLRPGIQDLLDRFATGLSHRPGFVATPGAVAFDTTAFRTTLSFRPVDLAGRGGQRVTEIGEVRTVLPEAVQDATDRELAIFNSLAALGALVREPETGRLVVVSRHAFLATEDPLLRTYGLLMHAAALSHVDQVIAAFMMATGGRVAAQSAWPRRPEGEPSPWDEAAFAEIAAAMRSRGLDASADGMGLYAALPWPPQERWPLDWNRRASLLTLSTREPHPMFGDGLCLRLELPVAPPVEEQVAMANRLNQLEAEAADVPPFFGAWCAVPGTRRVAWAGFVADAWFKPGLVSELAAWMAWRHWGLVEGVREGRV